MKEPLHSIGAASAYLAALLRRPEMVDWLWGEKNLYRRYPLTELFEELQQAGQRSSSLRDLLASFRAFKQRHFLRIGGRDLLGLADVAETTAQLSDLAGVALQVGLEVLAHHPEWWWTAGDPDAWHSLREATQLVVMGLGKLGGQELNYVSDVDLLFLHAHRDERAAQAVRLVPMLNHLCQGLSRLLAELSEGDRVFQVDLRLRPQGKDGELVPSFAAASYHYLLHGRAWERQMLLKGRPVAGDRALGMAFLREVRPFVFRRFLDFQALDELRGMRDRILREALTPRADWHQFDVKLGIGGIREIEFLVQSFQLIYGGRHPELDEPNTLTCLVRLERLRLLPSEVVRELSAAYLFLRRVEHWVQLDQNRQTQRLPQSAEGRQRLVRALGFAEDEGGLLDALEGHCGLVHKHFLALFEASQEGELEGERPVLLANAAERVASRWQRSAATPADGSWERLRACLEHFAPGVRETVFEVLEPYATEEGVGAEVADKIFVRLERYFSQARRRPGLVRLLNSAAAWLNGLSHALIRSGLVADLLSHQPSLVEGLVLTPGEGEEVGTAWREPAEAILASLSDFESALEWIRRLKNERLLQIALADLAGSLDASGVERALSDLAEFVIGRTFHLVRNERGLPGDLPLAVLALGKLGSREMNYLSDLDLVFVYHATDAEESGQIPTEVVRFIQRFMRLLSTPLQEGPGYAVDTRLRPTGNYGPLAVTRQSWFDYYTHRADVWELQALLRGRAIAGPETLCRWLEAGAQAVCYQARDPVTVWRRLCHLRARMQHERAEESEYLADIKLGAGSIADIEFLVQGQQLLQGHARPELRTTSIRAALRGLQESDAATDPWREALTLFEGLRALEQRLQLHTNLSAMGVAPGHLATMRELGLWPPPHGPTGLEDWHDLLRWRRRVQQIFRRWCAPG